MNRDVLLIIQIISGLFLTVLIVLQVKGKGFGRVWGASSVSFTRRGLENQVFRATFIISFIFLLVSTLELLA
ncbi:preprotein translocase subunit SecG [Candidatus Woesebacteria bacterium RIFCSPHIGHO2_02_FULL_42_20]|uniref:Protein-export membrane protein SecG n=1 Tax=Candidatus Woesebacteria bacterium RIFCSPHIGHO2_12_FULL_41_24 TaxID=1802510 RepID=A0A1F8AQ64_9BACT|nr:MAG: preprotein translocase subunit SecG [Candidatus Woesebacteria bacterium RBG_16_41_13]OGM30718.1 MAG: preprotein translocase subunit SecG [Candidatus Woesebacteria bacterium RIFCSPHIGHO2_01_FULL_42_80]OGM35855.1 MAG: preprotein translocase subunit SecG [Candidatus Woesebacteria bacterium RIFCSPHIGHO2_02_FULL_42_20]OGM53913.1 MAG: preprotein translocase subunit SecG [Candidatus Woesebacteria bacterium RIFCSPHIGHO2_12_FULL_41_24]OGM66105.1 MAG: preprotein translocase subunit SecG [Candidat